MFFAPIERFVCLQCLEQKSFENSNFFWFNRQAPLNAQTPLYKDISWLSHMHCFSLHHSGVNMIFTTILRKCVIDRVSQKHSHFLAWQVTSATTSVHLWTTTSIHHCTACSIDWLPILSLFSKWNINAHFWTNSTPIHRKCTHWMTLFPSLSMVSLYLLYRNKFSEFFVRMFYLTVPKFWINIKKITRSTIKSTYSIIWFAVMIWKLANFSVARFNTK